MLASAGFLKTFQDPRFNWRFETEPGPGVDGRAIYFPRGKVLGGSSINGSLWVRGQARDFDTWAQRGNIGWSWAGVLPAFRNIEDHAGGADGWRDAGGPRHVSAVAEQHPICEAFITGAVEECGLPRAPDCNGARQEGAFYYQRSIRRGRRHSAASGFLRPALRRPNLRVETGALALRLELEGRRVMGVVFRQRGCERRVRAAREVLLAAGAVGSPHLLQLSGIGPAALLASLGIAVAHDLPGVGENLQDRYATRVVHAVTRPITLNERTRMPRLGKVARWLLTGGGLPGMSPAHAGAFLRSRGRLDDPDLQFVLTPASHSVEGVIGALQRTPGMTVGVWQMRPESRGHVRARSPDPAAAPAIQPNYLSAPADRAVADGDAGVRALPQRGNVARRRGGGRRGAVGVRAGARGSTVYHAVGACRMGTDALAGVDPLLRLRGLDGLRVADASVMPTMVSANTNVTAMMIAERAAAMVLAERRAALAAA